MSAKKKILAIGLFATIITANFYVLSMDHSIIPNASYYIYDDGKKHVTFYTFDGDKIQTIEFNSKFESIINRLDPKAPKPQPVFYEIKQWKIMDNECVWCIVFYDKNGNTIASYRYDRKTHEIIIYTQNLMEHELWPSTFKFNEENPRFMVQSFFVDLSNISCAITK